MDESYRTSGRFCHQCQEKIFRQPLARSTKRKESKVDLWFHNLRRRSTTTEAKRTDPQSRWRHKFKKKWEVLAHCTATLREFLAFLYIILYAQKSWVCMKHVSHWTCVCGWVLQNIWRHVHKYRCVLVYYINTRDMCTCTHTCTYVHTYVFITHKYTRCVYMYTYVYRHVFITHKHICLHIDIHVY